MDVAFGASFLRASIAPAIAIGLEALVAEPCFHVISAAEAARSRSPITTAMPTVCGLSIFGKVRFGWRHGALSGAVMAGKELRAFGEPQDESGL